MTLGKLLHWLFIVSGFTLGIIMGPCLFQDCRQHFERPCHEEPSGALPLLP